MYVRYTPYKMHAISIFKKAWRLHFKDSNPYPNAHVFPYEREEIKVRPTNFCVAAPTTFFNDPSNNNHKEKRAHPLSKWDFSLHWVLHLIEWKNNSLLNCDVNPCSCVDLCFEYLYRHVFILIKECLCIWWSTWYWMNLKTKIVCLLHRLCVMRVRCSIAYSCGFSLLLNLF